MDYPLKTVSQLRPLLLAFRKKAGLTQQQVAQRLGISQQSYAAFEANPATASVERLFRVLRLLAVDMRLAAGAAEAEPAQRKVAVKMAAVKKPVARKPALKTAAKKTAVKKAAVKKTVARKSAPAKTTSRKPAAARPSKREDW
ncbi:MULTISPECIES: helix-turn-helix domain-containing protein [unclassified Paraburkholderia]|uniref:helix-turn-helix domain-containing protein n=1 Tax=unclassified Paraburkholderia TaxID=2615204 RepID=UPI002AB2A677|nr:MULTISPECIES: helix-turn-helix domain-containing protein [unclassified Paraburkholderia]